jgi:hypothetical protein
MPERIPREPVEHDVKSWPHLFEATLRGDKLHEMRRAGERDYRVGDTMLLREYHPEPGRYTGRSLRLEITYVTSALDACALSDAGLNEGFCILSTRLLWASDTGGVDAV